MTTLSKILATTAVCTLMAGGAFAQTAQTGAAGGVEAEAATGGVGADGRPPAPEGQATGTVGTGAAAGTQAPGTATGTQLTIQSDVQPGATGTAASPGAMAAFTAASDGLARGERIEVVSQDGISLGHVNEAGQDERGATQLSITLDPILETNASTVTFIGLADVDAEGRIVLPMAQEEFVSQIQAQFGDQG